MELNKMCENCAKLGKDCKGTTEQVWTGCVNKTRRYKMEEIKTIYQLMQKVPSIKHALYFAAVECSKGNKEDYFTYCLQAAAEFEAIQDLNRNGYLKFTFDFREIDKQLLRLIDVIEVQKIRDENYPF